MIECEAFPSSGLVQLVGASPNGATVVTREVEGQPSYPLRGGTLTVTTGGLNLTDTEAPFGIPLRYHTRITLADRIVQRNMMLTPTFLNGVQGWVAGSGRTMTTEADATAHSATVGKVTGSGGGGSPPAPPTLVGHVDSTVFEAGSYTLTPPTGGGSPIATNDWMVIVHHQLSSTAAAATPSGWTLVNSTTQGAIRQIIWKRKRVGGDTGYTVAAPSGSASIGTLLYVRNATDTHQVTTPVIASATQANTLTTERLTTLYPALILDIFSGNTIAEAVAPGSGSVTNTTWQYTLASGTLPRTTTIGKVSNTGAGLNLGATLAYADLLTEGVAVAIAFVATATLTDRVIAKGKAGLITANGNDIRVTGRFKFQTPLAGLWLWQDVLNQGTWDNLKATKADWLAVRGASASETTDYLRLFAAFVNPADGTYYTNPVQVFGATDASVNTWIDFSFYTQPVGATIPTTAELWLFHGVALKEYGVVWFLDELGVTPDATTHDTVYWFSGSSTPPANSEDYLGIVGDWTDESNDATMTWTSTTNNSISLFRAPSIVSSDTICQLDPVGIATDIVPCQPIFLSDPVSVSLGIWVGLLGIESLNYPARQQVHQIISRAAPVAISDIRGWATGTMTVLTTTLAERNLLLTVFGAGRILHLRNPDRTYPENDWYLSCGDLTESRISPDHRDPLREWEIPFTRVERPVGLIDGALGTTWQQVLDMGTWETLRNSRTDWLDVLVNVP